MFCIFLAISLRRAFKLKAMENGLRHFSLADVFRTFWNLGACLPFRKLINMLCYHFEILAREASKNTIDVISNFFTHLLLWYIVHQPIKMRYNTWNSLMWVYPEINSNIQLHRMRVKSPSESYLVVGDGNLL